MPGEEFGTVAAGEGATIGLMAALGKIFPVWAKSMAKIELAGKLAKPAAGAGAIWALAQPWDDDAISKAWNDWRTVNMRLAHLRFREWDDKLKAIQAAWPEGEDRKAFDRFMQRVYHEIYQFETATGQMATAVQNAQSNIHRIVNTSGAFVDSMLGIIILSELMQFYGYRLVAHGEKLVAEAAKIPPVPAYGLAKIKLLGTAALFIKRGEAVMAKAMATKDSSGLFLMGGTISAIVGVSATLIFSLGDLLGLASADNQFPQPQINLGSDGQAEDSSKTDFDDIKRGSVAKSGKEGWTYT
ncbi:hypothetical protein [Streptosporangium sp. NPDC000396]|uniref:hypothetical protein n=1 Tax=Streptosporangium sp. NPDC000396 TaxID=3366185 RepID=UPI0036790A7C